MPLPTPRKGEKPNDFIGRCMGDATTRKDFPRQDQRAAVCFRQLRNHKGGEFDAIEVASLELWIALHGVREMFRSG